ncbi:MAG: hypothetical protein LBK47_09610 [Prevotellaceae bacterium]|jgi:hypothetical protein|nr:hypothetical protein [Prevotellaceae bacterium]
MNKFYSFVFSLLCFSCTTQYKTLTGSHILTGEYDKTNLSYARHYLNDKLNFSSELSWSNSYDTTINITKDDKKILKQIHFNDKNDTLLYKGSAGFLILKDKNVDLSKFRVFNLYDSVISATPFTHWKVNFYRKTTIHSKDKSFIINDLIPFNGKYFQRITYFKHDEISAIDPTNPDDVVFFNGMYRDALSLTKNTYHNILQNKIVELKNPYKLFGDCFFYNEKLNYGAADVAEDKSQNYYKPEDKGFFDQMLATYYSFANNVEKSDSVWINLTKHKTKAVYPAKTGELVDLLKLTQNQQVVMFNEAHNAPKHRLLVTNLLDSLYAQGFRYLGLEALGEDSTFLKTGYPNYETGFYTVEPHFSNLIRKAHKIGYKVFGYDVDFGDREQEQAQNIYDKTLRLDPDAKVLIYAGYSHIDTVWMAGKFQKISGVDPLTIDQTYSYFYCLGKPATNFAYLIQPDSADNYIKSADLFLLNDLDIKNGSIKIDIPVDEEVKQICKIICIYNQKEYTELTKNGKIPLPVFVQNFENTPYVMASLEKDNYLVLFMDNYGNVLNEQPLIIR